MRYTRSSIVSPKPLLRPMFHLVRFLLSCSYFVQKQKSSQRRQKERTMGWELWLYYLSYRRKALFRVAHLDFPSDGTRLKSLSYIPGNKSPVFFTKKKCWHVDYCHRLAAWFSSWDVLWTPTSHSSSCLWECQCSLACFCGDPQELWHHSALLSYIFQMEWSL